MTDATIVLDEILEARLTDADKDFMRQSALKIIVCDQTACTRMIELYTQEVRNDRIAGVKP